MKRYFLIVIFGLFFLQGIWADDFTDTDKDYRKKIKVLREEINLLNLVNGLNLSKKQMKKIIPMIRKAVELNREFCNSRQRHNQKMFQALSQLKRDSLKYGFIPKYTELAAGLAELREKKLVRQYYKKLNGIERKVRKILTPAQRYVLKGYSSCLIPPQNLKDPVRVGQAASSDEEVNFLTSIREMDQGDYFRKIPLLLEQHLCRVEQLLGKYSPAQRPREKGRLRKICDQARKCTDIEFELKKARLAKKFSPHGQVEVFKQAARDFVSLIKRFRGAVGKVGKNFFHPAMVRILKIRISQMENYHQSNTVLDRIRGAQGCKKGHCAIGAHDHIKLNKKPTVKELAKTLRLKFHQEKKLRAVLKREKARAMKVLSQPNEKGVVPFKILLKAFKIKNAVGKQRAMQDFFISLFSKTGETTYMEELAKIQITIDGAFRKILTEDQYLRFSFARIDYLDIELE